MAFLAPAAAGGGLFGGAFGNIALAALGIGIQLAAAYFFPQKVKGPRAESTKAQTAKYGDYIARVHGHGRTAGAAIWLKEDHVDEHKETEREGGKALGPEVTTYTYTADFAIAFAWNGPAAGIPRMWADDKLILDNSAESLEEVLNGETTKGIGVAKGAKITIYLGTADQDSDPDIEADRGVDNVPAWPYVVWAKLLSFPLDEFGIRLPNIEGEVVMAGDTQFTTFHPQGDIGHTDLFGNVMVSNDAIAGVANVISLPDFVTQATYDPTDYDPTFSPAGSWYVTQSGDIVVARRFSIFFGSTRYLYVYDSTGTGLKQVVTSLGSGLNNFGTFCDIVIDGINHLFLHDHPDLTCYTYDGSEWSVAWVSNGMGMSVITGCFSAGPDLLYFRRADSSNELYTVNWAAMTSLSTSTLVNPPGLLGTPLWISYDVETDSVFIGTTLGVFAYNPELDELLASNTDPTFFQSLIAASTLPNQPRIEGPAGSGTILLRNNGASTGVGDVILLSKTDLTEVDRWTQAEAGTGWQNIGVGGYWKSSPDYGFFWASGFTNRGVFFLPRLAKERIPLASIIASECTYAELPYDVSGITGLVEGYVVRDNTSPRGVLEDLARVKFFDFTQSDGVIKFFMRQSSTKATSMVIPNDLGFAEGSDPAPKFVEEEYIDFREIPQRVVLSYNSVEADYRTGAQSNTPPNPNKKKDGEWPEFPVPDPIEVSAPAGQNEGQMPFEFQTSLVMTDDEAAQTVDIFYNELLDSSSVYHATVGPKFLRTHPGDVVNLDLDFDRREMGVVITRQEGDLAIKLDFIRRTTIYTSDAIGVPTPNNPQSLLGISRIGAIFIDGHLMRAEDDSNSFYTGVYQAERGRFTSGTIYKSTDLGASYAPWLGFTTAVLYGRAQSVLPDRPHPWAWDNASSLIFQTASTEGVPNLPSSVTPDQLLADDELNGFAIKSGTEWEYIQAAEVTVDSNGLWTLSKLLRGRKGTDFAMADHVVGDIVVYLDPNAMDRPPDGEKDLVRMYAPIATSTVFTDQYAVTFTNTSKGLRPWSPVCITGARDASGNLTIDWKRRDRLGQQWPEDGPEDPPMSETVERYQVYIYSLSAGILRTITVDGISETPYSAADQTTDFGAPVPVGELMVGVKQYSSVYGYGIEKTQMI